MRLFGVEQHSRIAFAELHTYVCAGCEAVQTATVHPRP
jgi:hypothetical protein